MSTETERLVAAIEELGVDEEAVYERLKTAGVKGVPGAENCCPVANWLTGKGFEHVRVYGDRIESREGLMSTPMQIEEFITAFDGGFFPELQQKGGDA